jgi:hypothetical protein
MSNGPGEPPSGPPTPPPSGPPTLPVSEGGLDSDDRMVIRVVEEFTQTVEEANREQSRIVIVTAVVALVSAIAGPLVSLKINSDQIDSQRDTSKEQAAALLKSTTEQNALEAGRSESEFIRSERRVAYADYLSTFNNGTVDITEIGGQITTPGYPPRLLAKDLQKVIDVLKDEQRDYFKVILVASPDSREQAKNARAKFEEHCVRLINFARSRLNGTQYSVAQLRQFQREFSNQYDLLITLSASFIETGRIDLKSNLEDTEPTATESPDSSSSSE